MPRPKKEAAHRAYGVYEIKATIGHTFDGKPIRKSFYSSISKADAKLKSQEYIIQHEVTNIVGVTAETSDDITFTEWAEKWLTTYKKPNVSENTYKLTYELNVKKHLLPYFGKAQLRNIKSIDVQRFFSIKQEQLSESVLDKLRLCLNGIFDSAIDNDLIVKNPVKNVTYTSTKEKKTKHIWNDDEIAIAKAFFKVRRPEAYLALETGLRRGEILGLMWSDIDLKAKTLSVNRSIAGKEGGGVEIRPPKWDSYRTIPISSELCEFLSEYPRKSLYVFPNSKNNLQVPNTFSQDLERAMEDLHKLYPKITELTSHELRHTRGTQLRRNGADIYTIQKIMGHRDINVTANIYVHDEIETTRKAANIT